MFFQSAILVAMLVSVSIYIAESKGRWHTQSENGTDLPTFSFFPKFFHKGFEINDSNEFTNQTSHIWLERNEEESKKPKNITIQLGEPKFNDTTQEQQTIAEQFVLGVGKLKMIIFENMKSNNQTEENLTLSTTQKSPSESSEEVKFLESLGSKNAENEQSTTHALYSNLPFLYLTTETVERKETTTETTTKYSKMDEHKKNLKTKSKKPKINGIKHKPVQAAKKVKPKRPRKPKKRKDPNAGAVVGGLFATLIVFIIAFGIAGFFYNKNRRRTKSEVSKELTYDPHNEWAPDHISATQFSFKGPLQITSSQPFVMKHELENEKVPPVRDEEHVVFDDSLNAVYEIGSQIDRIIPENSKHMEAVPNGEIPKGVENRKSQGEGNAKNESKKATNKK
ncbi:hypothetical protein Tcan_15033 [Toxocara canis]|uniref:Uncharacterized protein n=1 Tax=Toxocara canis TaxID=6265 RepID=A0A0B2W158_TOXCA|nr:hypothetical protein Tcan_15033 [Toxocara canis]